ncbi:hypothetical protein EIP86_003459 [Pleurotus ostreatoroseus]|nr:hypothetical protein EIP86_003459 [Pleurotus ostreatoroseus]
MDTQGIRVPTHIATYQFPSLQEGIWSDGTLNTIYVSHSASLAREHSPLPFVPAPDFALIDFNRIYYGPTDQDSICISCYVQRTTFLSALELYRNRTTSTDPLVFPWAAWGPIHTRCSDRTQSRSPRFPGMITYGSLIYEDGCIRDFNQREIARDLGTRPSHSIRSVLKNMRFSSRLPFGSSGRDFNATPKEDWKVPGYPGRIILRPTVIPAGKIFIEDVITMLPYRETKITWEEEQPAVVLWGEVWVGVYRRENTVRIS